MQSLPLFKFGPRARLTSWGIALCTMFVVASFAVVNGLGESMDKLSDNFETEYSLLVAHAEGGPGYFETSTIPLSSDRAAMGIFAKEKAEPAGFEATVFCIYDPGGVLPETLLTSGSAVLLGRDVPSSAITSIGGLDVMVAGMFSSAMFSSSWVLGSMELLDNLTQQKGRFNFAIAVSLSESEVSSLENMGFVVTDMIGIIDFLDSGVNEIQADAGLALIPSAFVIAVLAYSFMGMEISDRRHDIGIIKTVGAGRYRVLAYLLAEALILCVWGAALGLALGIITSYSIMTLASAMFSSIFVVKATESLLLVAFLAAVAAGMTGALVPSLRMTLSRPVDDLREVVP